MFWVQKKIIFIFFCVFKVLQCMPIQYKKVSNLDRALAFGQLQAGRSSREIARAFNTSRQSIDRIRQRYAATGDVKDLPRSGRPRCTSNAEDRFITNVTRRNRFTSAQDMNRRIRRQRGVGVQPISVQTIRNRLHAAGSSPVFLPRNHGFHSGTEQRVSSLLVTISDGTDKSGEQSCFSMKAGFDFVTLMVDYRSGDGEGSGMQKPVCNHGMRIMVEVSWFGQVLPPTDVLILWLSREFSMGNDTLTKFCILMCCLFCDKRV